MQLQYNQKLNTMFTSGFQRYIDRTLFAKHQWQAHDHDTKIRVVRDKNTGRLSLSNNISTAQLIQISKTKRNVFVFYLKKI